jgi:hypothetical protein
MQQQQQQIATYPPLTEEQNGLLKILQTEGKTSGHGWLYILMGVVTLLYACHICFFRLVQDMLLALVFLLIGTAQIVLGWHSINKRKNLEIDISAFFGCKNPLAAGILTKAIVVGRDKHRPECIATLVPLLYDMTDGEADSAFNEEQKQMLREIAAKPYWRKREPDLVAAALVGLATLGDARSTATLLNLTRKSWQKQERWVGQAAAICLEQEDAWEKTQINKTATGLIKPRHH